MPRRIGAQQAALQSWKAADLSVVSVNSKSEAMELRPYFPDIRFQILDNPVVDPRGRPLVPIDALIHAAKNDPAEICGIINSDVEFRGQQTFFDLVRREIPNALVFGNRTDFQDAGFSNGNSYRNGYDFFFWEKDNSVLLEGASMVLGLPWWDFWLPLHAYGQGLTTKRFVTSSMAHITHPVGYDDQTYLKFGHQFAKTLTHVYGRCGNESAPAVRTFLYHLFAAAYSTFSSQQSDALLDQVGILCDVSNCMIDALSQTVTLPDSRLASGTLAVV